MSDKIISLIRTWSPMVAGYVVAKLATLGFDVGVEARANLEALLVVTFSALYYWAARALEARWPKLGWLLGYAKQPEYRGSK